MTKKDIPEIKSRSEKKGLNKKKDKSGNFIYSSKHIRLYQERKKYIYLK